MLSFPVFNWTSFEILDPTFPANPSPACPLWLTPFFSQPSVLPRPELLSFDNHLDCPRLKFAFLTSPVSSALRILPLFSGLRTLYTNQRIEFRPNPFLFFRLRTLAKTMGGVPLSALLPTRFYPLAAPVYNRVSIIEAFS